jgi:hypothetical protein
VNFNETCTMGVFGTQWNSKKLEYNSYSDELICQTNFRLSRRSGIPTYRWNTGLALVGIAIII